MRRQENVDEPRLTHLVIPFHAKQIDRLSLFLDFWIKYPPCESISSRNQYSPELGKQIELVFYIGSMNDTRKEEQESLNMFNRLPENVRRCFISAKTQGHRYNQSDNSYLLGSKGMFERFLNGDLGLTQAHYYAFYMEPDVIPVRPGWLSFIDAQCRWPSPSFWIKGSQFRSTPLPRHTKNIVTKMHINGNAVYNLKDPEFKKYYFETILPFLKSAGHKPWELAYDLFFMTNVLENANDYANYQKYLHKFVLSDYIQNRWHCNYTVSEVLLDSDSTYLVHGGIRSEQ